MRTPAHCCVTRQPPFFSFLRKDLAAQILNRENLPDLGGGLELPRPCDRCSTSPTKGARVFIYCLLLPVRVATIHHWFLSLSAGLVLLLPAFSVCSRSVQRLTPPPPTDPITSTPIVCLLQLAAGERTFVVDMLHVCRPKSAAAATTVVEETASGLTKREALLEEALGTVLGSPGVVKIGLGPKVGGISGSRATCRYLSTGGLVRKERSNSHLVCPFCF